MRTIVGQAPPLVAELIRLVNICKSDSRELMAFDQVSQSVQKGWRLGKEPDPSTLGIETKDERKDFLRTACLKRIAKWLPEAVRAHLFPDEIDSYSYLELWNAEWRYREFHRRAGELMVMAEFSEEKGNSVGAGLSTKISNFKVESQGPLILTVDPHGLLTRNAVKDDVLDGIKVHRIRFCQRCRNLFWLEREGARFCSNRCANADRQMRHRNRKSAIIIEGIPQDGDERR